MNNNPHNYEVVEFKLRPFGLFRFINSNCEYH
jgi:hypothetical protein